MLDYRRIFIQLPSHLAVLLAACIATNVGAVDRAEMDALIEQVKADRLSLDAALSNKLDVAEDTKTLETNLHESQRQLNFARASALAAFCDLTPQAIVELHDGGKSWQQIANDLGIHPSVIGIEIVDQRPPTLAPISASK